MSTTYRKKDTVEAVKWDGVGSTANAFLGDRYGVDWEYATNHGELTIRIGPDNHDAQLCYLGNYLVRFPSGRVEAQTPAFFEATWGEIAEPRDPRTGETFAEWRAKFNDMRDAEANLSAAYLRLRMKLRPIDPPNSYMPELSGFPSNPARHWAWTEHRLDELLRIKDEALEDVSTLEARLRLTVRDIDDLKTQIIQLQRLQESAEEGAAFWEAEYRKLVDLVNRPKEEQVQLRILNYPPSPVMRPSADFEPATSAMPDGSFEVGGYNLTDELSPNAPTVEGAMGGKQSALSFRFDLFPVEPLFEIAGVLDHGEKKYGEGNWQLIDARSHVNHALVHIFGWLLGDRQDRHLAHAGCRILFAMDRDDDATEVK